MGEDGTGGSEGRGHDPLRFIVTPGQWPHCPYIRRTNVSICNTFVTANGAFKVYMNVGISTVKLKHAHIWTGSEQSFDINRTFKLKNLSSFPLQWFGEV